MRPNSRHSYECRVRRADLHGNGTVGDGVYVDYLQEARLDPLPHHDRHRELFEERLRG